MQCCGWGLEVTWRLVLACVEPAASAWRAEGQPGLGCIHCIAHPPAMNPPTQLPPSPTHQPNVTHAFAHPPQVADLEAQLAAVLAEREEQRQVGVPTMAAKCLHLILLRRLHPCSAHCCGLSSALLSLALSPPICPSSCWPAWMAR